MDTRGTRASEVLDIPAVPVLTTGPEVGLVGYPSRKQRWLGLRVGLMVRLMRGWLWGGVVGLLPESAGPLR